MEQSFKQALTPLLIGTAIGAGLLFLATRLETKGLSYLHGDNPISDIPKGVPFNPSHFVVVYMKYGKDLKEPHLKIRHAYFNAKADENTDEIGCAIDLLREFDGSNQPTNGECKIDGKIRSNFRGFNFGKQVRIYAYIDNEGIAFNESNPISFTPFGAFDIPRNSVYNKSPNRSFYEAKVIDLPNTKDYPANGSPQLRGLRLYNLYKKDDGSDQIGEANTIYSINFNLLMCLDGKNDCDTNDGPSVIPTIVDPDGGNMGGGNPPPG